MKGRFEQRQIQSKNNVKTQGGESHQPAEVRKLAQKERILPIP